MTLQLFPFVGCLSIVITGTSCSPTRDNLKSITNPTVENLQFEILDSVIAEAEGKPLEELTLDELIPISKKVIDQTWSKIEPGVLPENALEHWEEMVLASARPCFVQLKSLDELEDETQSALKKLLQKKSSQGQIHGDYEKAAETFRQVLEKRDSTMHTGADMRVKVISTNLKDATDPKMQPMHAHMRHLFSTWLINQWYEKCLKPTVKEMKDLHIDILAKLGDVPIQRNI